MTKKRSPEAWKEAKKRCRLNNDDIQMAKQLGMTPKGLIKNIPTANQKWKAPVKDWVRDIYYEKFGKVIETNPDSSSQLNEKNKRQEKVTTFEPWDIEDLPF